MLDYKMCYFDNIPDEIVLYISKFLLHEDSMHLSSTCWRLRLIFVNLCLEEHSQLVHVADINLRGADGPGHSWQPSVYFETPPFTSCIHSVKISCTSKDQGWGNQKGHIYLHLIRPIKTELQNLSINSEQKSQINNGAIKWKTEILVTDYRDLFGSAPHKLGSACTTLTYDNPIVSLVLPGDYFRFMKNVGGGGGHKLFVEEFKVILEISTKSSTESYHGLASYIE